ncbi:MAG: MaoC family dehydratase N-terminal domain-containing protein [Hyphomicrobiales bacterium]|nr:MaoC family dehydratase N-terminal domain-containing protein [Hyphomicrobiales bacterium]
MATMENRTYDEIAIGEAAEVVREVTRADIELFAATSGDVNPAHLDDAYAGATRFKGVIMHGMWSGAIISRLLGVDLPGPGTIYISQSLAFKRPVTIGDRITFKATVKEKRDDKKIVVLDCTGTNQDGKVVVEGEAVVMAPTEKIVVEKPVAAAVSLTPNGGETIAYEPK